MTSIVDYLKDRGSPRKSFGCVLITDNTWPQLMLILGVLTPTEQDHYMQFVMKATKRNADAILIGMTMDS